jgi:hypothetical protein
LSARGKWRGEGFGSVVGEERNWTRWGLARCLLPSFSLGRINNRQIVFLSLLPVSFFFFFFSSFQAKTTDTHGEMEVDVKWAPANEMHCSRMK